MYAGISFARTVIHLCPYYGNKTLPYYGNKTLPYQTKSNLLCTLDMTR